MSEKNENMNQEAPVNEESKKEDEIVTEESIGKKVLKVGLKVLAGVATLVAGIFIGRATNGHDDDSSEGSEETETNE